MKEDILKFLNFLKITPKHEFSKEYLNFLIESKFQDLFGKDDNLFEKILNVNGKIKLFHLLALMINSDSLFNNNERYIIEYSFSYSKSENSTLQSIASKLNLTRERIRQIKRPLEEKIQSYFLFISNFDTDDFLSYDFKKTDSLKVIDNSLVETINRKEEVNFNKLFYSLIFGLFLKKTHSILGDDETLNEKKGSTRRNKYFQCFYLIDKEIFDIFDFQKFIADINSQLEERIIETYSLHFEGYIYQFFKEKHSLQYLSREKKHILQELIKTCEVLVMNEFELVVNFDGYLVFERNKTKQIHEYAIEALEETGNVMKAEDIAKNIMNKYSGLEISEQSVKSTIHKEKDVFIFFGRTGTYGLRKWEIEQENIKGGTIRDIAEEFLRESNTPKHIYEISQYVQKFRETNDRNVATNIGLEKSKRFQFFLGDFVGLKGKTYGAETLLYKKISGAHFINKQLVRFNGLDIEAVVEYYQSKYGYAPIQVKYILHKKMLNSEIEITQENKLKI